LDNIKALLNPESLEDELFLFLSLFFNKSEPIIGELDVEVAFATALKTTIRASFTIDSSKIPVSNRISTVFNPVPILPPSVRSNSAEIVPGALKVTLQSFDWMESFKISG